MSLTSYYQTVLYKYFCSSRTPSFRQLLVLRRSTESTYALRQHFIAFASRFDPPMLIMVAGNGGGLIQLLITGVTSFLKFLPRWKSANCQMCRKEKLCTKNLTKIFNTLGKIGNNFPFYSSVINVFAHVEEGLPWNLPLIENRMRRIIPDWRGCNPTILASCRVLQGVMLTCSLPYFNQRPALFA